MSSNSIEIPEDQLEAVIGRAAVSEYHNGTDTEKRGVRVWAAKLQRLSDIDFLETSVAAIAASAVANSKSLPNHPAWCYSTACLFEAKRRYVAAGHSPKCLGSTLYSNAYNIASRTYGHSTSPLNPCTCGKEG